jgi:hypothetical protein
MSLLANVALRKCHSTDLLSCYHVNQVLMCDAFGVMSNVFNDTCLGALYMQKFKEAQNLCNFKVVLVEEDIYQLKRGRFIFYLPKAIPVHLKCFERVSLTATPESGDLAVACTINM